MQTQKGSKPHTKKLFPNETQWSKHDRKAIADLFALLLEMYIDQQDVTKGGSNAKANQ